MQKVPCSYTALVTLRPPNCGESDACVARVNQIHNNNESLFIRLIYIIGDVTDYPSLEVKCFYRVELTAYPCCYLTMVFNAKSMFVCFPTQYIAIWPMLVYRRNAAYFIVYRARTSKSASHKTLWLYGLLLLYSWHKSAVNAESLASSLQSHFFYNYFCLVRQKSWTEDTIIKGTDLVTANGLKVSLLMHAITISLWLHVLFFFRCTYVACMHTEYIAEDLHAWRHACDNKQSVFSVQ